jgi:hypothetical protein
MKFVAALLLSAMIAAVPAAAQDKAAPAAAAEPAKAVPSTMSTTIGELLDNPATKAIVEKHLPGFSSHPQIDMARSLSLKAVQAYAPQITDDILAKIEAELAALGTAQSG